jgi:hypothetical protein
MKTFKQHLTEVENWDNQIATNDETGKTYRVKDMYDYAKNNGKFVQDLPIKDTDALEWWDKSYSMDKPENVKRMKNADTSFPVLAVEYEKGKYSITDGLNRIKKAHSLENKKTIPAYIISNSDMKNIKPVNKENDSDKVD